MKGFLRLDAVFGYPFLAGGCAGCPRRAAVLIKQSPELDQLVNVNPRPASCNAIIPAQSYPRFSIGGCWQHRYQHPGWGANEPAAAVPGVY